MLVDLQGSLKTLPEEGELYEPTVDFSKTNVEWNTDKLDIQKTANNPKNQFLNDLANSSKPVNVLNKTYDFENDVEVWSDFMYSRFHPRSINIIKEYQHCNEHTPFDAFPLGTDLWKKTQFEEDFSDKIRNYVEECDSFQVIFITPNLFY